MAYGLATKLFVRINHHQQNEGADEELSLARPKRRIDAAQCVPKSKAEKFWNGRLFFP